jgi:hypothetical protein
MLLALWIRYGTPLIGRLGKWCFRILDPGSESKTLLLHAICLPKLLEC